MRIRMNLKFYLIIFLLFSSSSFAIDIHCPEEIKTIQSIVKLKEWDQMLDTLNSKQCLIQMSIYDGNPREGASLVPDNEGSKQDPYWTFSGKGERAYWIACFYSQSVIRLIKEIPRKIKKCTLRFKDNPKRVDFLSCQ
jgi:hypothetical protein